MDAIAYWLPIVWAALIATAVALYVVLDGFDLGLGILFPFTPDEKLLFTTNGTSNDVSVIDVDRLRVVRSIRVGRYPWGVVVAPF